MSDVAYIVLFIAGFVAFTILAEYATRPSKDEEE